MKNLFRKVWKYKRMTRDAKKEMEIKNNKYIGSGLLLIIKSSPIALEIIIIKIIFPTGVKMEFAGV